jgi:hypothetical protein
MSRQRTEHLHKSLWKSLDGEFAEVIEDYKDTCIWTTVLA